MATNSPYARRLMRLQATLTSFARDNYAEHDTKESLQSAVEECARRNRVHGLAPRDWWGAVSDATESAWTEAQSRTYDEVDDETRAIFEGLRDR